MKQTKIEQIDQNFQTNENKIDTDTTFWDSTEAPFRIYGLLTPAQTGGTFLRMPTHIAGAVSDGVSVLNAHTAGGRIRFRTNSPFITIRAKLHRVENMPHMTLCGSAGFDLYYLDKGENRYSGTFIPPRDVADTCIYESRINMRLLTGETEYSMRDITIHFPLYSGVRSLQIGLKNGSAIQSPTEYRYTKPIVFYGSSITQGGCASRPGNAYQSIIARDLDCDFINLGFSGNAKGEDAMADYIANLPMSVFVYDYDHNAPTVEHLQNTHERFFLRVRAQRPDLPVIMISRPQTPLSPEGKMRRSIIETNYQNALKRADKNVWFINGEEFFLKHGGNSETVDGAHPNDLGFMYMAEQIETVLKQVFRTQ
ncbi:MAG: hypothetical protein HFE78_03690 [Clostridiales bacterium]|nr:hypothetical protein [Clostridiales bacterium]